MMAFLKDLTVTKAAAIALYLTTAALVGVILLATYVIHDGRVESARAAEERNERVSQINYVNQAQCDSLRALYDKLHDLISESDERIEQIDYYRDHPDEAAVIREANRRALELFDRPACPADISLEHERGDD